MFTAVRKWRWVAGQLRWLPSLICSGLTAAFSCRSASAWS